MSDGTVHSGLKEGKALALLYEHRPELKRPPRPFDVERVLSNIRQEARAIIAHATPEQLQSVPAEFQEIAGEVVAAAAARIRSEEKKGRRSPDLQVPAWIMEAIAGEDDLTEAIKPLNRLKKLNALNPAPAQTTK